MIVWCFCTDHIYICTLLFFFVPMLVMVFVFFSYFFVCFSPQCISAKKKAKKGSKYQNSGVVSIPDSKIRIILNNNNNNSSNNNNNNNNDSKNSDDNDNNNK